MATWTVYEFSRLYKGKRTAIDGEHLLLAERQFDFLKRRVTEDVQNHNNIFRYRYRDRREILICQNYVGIVFLPDGDQIEILPKTHKYSLHTGREQNDAIDRDRRNLVRMLQTTRHIPSKVASTATLDIVRMPLLDVFIGLFLSEVNMVVKRGVARSYHGVQENMSYLKGKLLVSEQLRHNLVNRHYHYMTYDELSTDRPENRLIRRALQWALVRVKEETAHLCQELLFYFSSIPSSRNILPDLKSWQKGRHLRHYESVRPWIEMIFSDLSPSSVDGNTEMLSLLFPMERVFEEYVAQKLKIQFPEYRIRTQVRSQSLVSFVPRESNEKSHLFQLRPDLHMVLDGRVTIADTKWKLIDENRPEKKYQISQADIYQMLAYNQTYQKDEKESPEIWLIYPRSHEFSKPLPALRFENGLTLKVLPFDIDAEILLGVGF